MSSTTRIHLDEVEGLGAFLELEVLMEGQGLEEGTRVAHLLMQRLEIKEDMLVTGAYADLLQK